VQLAILFCFLGIGEKKYPQQKFNCNTDFFMQSPGNSPDAIVKISFGKAVQTFP